jgi:2-polyprenyl-6-methoxyphenol hydroxylase-like FAD-dependent oxidoreductase
VDDPVLVVGGGIGGLTTALALVDRGVPCVVCEQAPALHEIGAGLGVWPAALRVFDRLGLGAQVRALSRPWETAGLRRSDGKVLVRGTAAEFAACLGEPTIGVHRGELQALLVRSLPPGLVTTGARCVDVRQSGGAVTAAFADGSSRRARAVIGADGQRSRIRAILFGERGLHDCRCVGWRGTAVQPRGSDWHAFVGETWGRAGRVGVIPISGDRVTWYAAARTFRSGGGKAELLERFGDWHAPIPALLAATDEDDIWRDHIYDLWPLRRWSMGKVTLLGDAAHPMTPELGQGACQAILDAFAVAHALASSADVTEAFREYERTRKGRARLVTLVARFAAAGGSADSRLARYAREQLMALVPAPIVFRALRAIAR